VLHGKQPAELHDAPSLQGFADTRLPTILCGHHIPSVAVRLRRFADAAAACHDRGLRRRAAFVCVAQRGWGWRGLGPGATASTLLM
jgi:hypothetical protein